MHFPTVTAADYASGNSEAAVVTYAAKENSRHNIHHILFGYDNTPTGGAITIAVGGVTVATIPVTSAGAGFLPIKLGGKLNQAIVITLADAGVFGYLTVGHTED